MTITFFAPINRLLPILLIAFRFKKINLLSIFLAAWFLTRKIFSWKRIFNVGFDRNLNIWNFSLHGNFLSLYELHAAQAFFIKFECLVALPPINWHVFGSFHHHVVSIINWHVFGSFHHVVSIIDWIRELRWKSRGLIDRLVGLVRSLDERVANLGRYTVFKVGEDGLLLAVDCFLFYLYHVLVHLHI